ncbi:MAG: phosphotransferase [Desulfobacterales bacterium]|nr:phosphotransferase [Desulfobacterales bacterium]
MKALILAAGYGERLKPHTNHTPKPLFPINGRPLLDIMIEKLIAAGCSEIFVNTHHLHNKIDRFISGQNYPIPVISRYEPEILGTGGAIKNLSDFWDDQPFFIINSDIATDIDLKEVYNFHLSHDHPATLVLHDYEQFNNVKVNKNGIIEGFLSLEKAMGHNGSLLTFTGIQVVDPFLLQFIPEKGFFSSIDAYIKMADNGYRIKSFLPENLYWRDIGTPERYRSAVLDSMIPKAVDSSFGEKIKTGIDIKPLSDDGSDRKWYRIEVNCHTLIMVDHGIRSQDCMTEADSFILIGRHLHDQGVAVPEIVLSEPFSGIVFLEDLGNIKLQNVISNLKSSEKIVSFYEPVINNLSNLAVMGYQNFNPEWTYQTAEYDRSLILEKECRYFVDSFLKTFLGQKVNYKDFENDFKLIAEKTVSYAIPGFLHRDMQSGNIMISDGKPYFIDFQGGRKGPVQYDLASLLIDPYVELSIDIQQDLLECYIASLSKKIDFDKDKFRKGFQYCCITRNMQILGAFGFLNKIKKKVWFEKYIPAAVKTLKNNLNALPEINHTLLKDMVASL